ncbi:MAG: transposase [Verrucomicrobiota bacterium]
MDTNESNRQEQIFKQLFGVEISRKTMGGWMSLIAQWLSLIYEALRDEIRASGSKSTPSRYHCSSRRHAKVCRKSYNCGCR